MPVFYRRPGVYLEESLLVNPVDVAGTTTVAAFVGVTLKGPPLQPMLIASWSDYVTLFGGFDLIQPPAPVDPNDVTAAAFPTGETFNNLADLKTDTTYGDAKYAGQAFLPGQYVTLEDGLEAHYPYATDKTTASPGDEFPPDPDITASDATNAAKLRGTPEIQTVTPGGTISGGTFVLTLLGTPTGTIPYNATAAQIKTAIDEAIPGNRVTVGGGPAHTAPFTLTYTDYTEAVPLVAVTPSLTGTSPTLTPATTTPGTVGKGFIPLPITAWTGTQAIYIGPFAFHWNGTAWTSGAPSGSPSLVGWKSGPMPGVPAPLPGKPAQALSYLPYAVYSFFQNGGRFAWIVRAISSDPDRDGTKSSISVTGTDNTVSPLTAFDLNAISVGEWGNGLRYNLITQSSTPTGNPPVQDVFAIQILLRNSAGQDEIVETFSNLSVSGNIAGTRRVDAVLNDAAAGSRYVRVSNVNPQQLRPQTTTNATPLTGGVDPDLPNALTLGQGALALEKIEGPMIINVCSYLANASVMDSADAPGQFISAVIDPRSMFPDREDVMAFNDGAVPRIPNQSSSAYMSSLLASPLVTVSNSYVASYAPWIVVPHPIQIGMTIAIPPAGAVMGVAARIDATVGVHRAPAGIVAGIANAVATQTAFTDTELGELNASSINIIRPVVGSGICVMGARTRKGYGADRYISARRTLINLKEQLRRSTQYAIFENNDERLWSSLRLTADAILRPMWEQGGLRGVTASEAYYIRCDASLNTLAVIASGEVRMEVGVALEYPAEFVVIKIAQIAGNQFNTVQPVA